MATSRVRSFLRAVRSLAFHAVPPPFPALRHAYPIAALAQWTRAHPAATVVAHRFALYEVVNAEVGGGQIDYLEFGVMHGKSINRWCLTNTHPRSRFIGFDSFEGLPEPWDGGMTPSKPKGAYSVQGRVPRCDDARVHFVKGWFQDTLPGFLDSFKLQAPMVVHHDSDLYSSTLYCLTMLDRTAVPGTVLIFDNFVSAAHEFRAFIDYTAAYRRRYCVVAAVGRMPYLKIAVRLE
jgi:hypothetical protein